MVMDPFGLEQLDELVAVAVIDGTGYTVTVKAERSLSQVVLELVAWET
jgi:hypothetical protein